MRCRYVLIETTAVASFLVAFTGIAVGSTQGIDDVRPDQDKLYGKPIKEIRIVGARNIKEDIINRELVSKVGEPYSEKSITKDRKNLDRLGVFSGVDVYGTEEDGGVILNIKVAETFRFLPVVSISISDENGASAGGGLKSVNLDGNATFFSGVVRFGEATTVEAVLANPWVAGNHIGFELRYFRRDRRNELFGFDEIANEGFLEVESYLGENGRVGGRFMFESIESNVGGKTLSPDNRDDVATFEVFAGYDSRDLHTNPRIGWWNDLTVSRGGALGTDSDFWRIHLDIRRFIPLGRNHSIGVFSLASLTTGEVGKEIATWQQFGLGGTNTVRGWDLGSRIGKNQFISTLEYRHAILTPRPVDIFGLSLPLGFQVGLFGDLGSAWNEEAEFSDSFIFGYGAGLRIILPYVGVARVDFGIDGLATGVLVHLGMREKAERQRERVR
jgi:outer membrane protein assembly factor BamA